MTVLLLLGLVCLFSFSSLFASSFIIYLFIYSYLATYIVYEWFGALCLLNSIWWWLHHFWIAICNIYFVRCSLVVVVVVLWWMNDDEGFIVVLFWYVHITRANKHTQANFSCVLFSFPHFRSVCSCCGRRNMSPNHDFNWRQII